MSKLEVKIAGITFKNPVIPASGTFGYGREYAEMYPLSKLGGISVKGTTITPRDGNPPPRIAAAPNGCLNSVGLQNPGIDTFINRELPWLIEQNTVIIANIAGSTYEEYGILAEKLDSTDVHMIEVNISCPNVKAGGAAFGVSAENAARVTKIVREKTRKPVIMKLSPNVTDITEIARAVESEGADAVSLINTLLGMRIDIKTRRPILYNNMGGLSGEAVFPVAVRMVYQTARAIKLPIIGIGGISSGAMAVEMIMAGATAVQVGTAIMTNPYAPLRIISEIEEIVGDGKITDYIGRVEIY